MWTSTNNIHNTNPIHPNQVNYILVLLSQKDIITIILKLYH
jgi:hypothetical protein